MKKVFSYIALLALIQAGAVNAAGVIIGNGIGTITEEQVKDLYLGRTTVIAGKEIHLTDCKPLQPEFLEEFIGKSTARYKKDWMRLLFADGVVIPLEFQAPEDVIDYIKRTPNSIGYVPGMPEKIDIGIKVLLRF